jgi:peptidyl-tRNA hydrolase
MYVIVRDDLEPSYQAVQAGHAAVQFQHDHSEVAKIWHRDSKYLVYLSARNEEHLKELLSKAENRNIKYSTFIEPDLGYEITAIALEPCEGSDKLCSSLPLALKLYNNKII